MARRLSLLLAAALITAAPAATAEPKPSTATAPSGYVRDEQGRLFQTHFDLNRRLFVGVYDGYAGRLGEPPSHAIRLETGSSWEGFDRSEERRHRYRFLEGSLQLAPLDGEALLFGYDRGRTGDEPVFWITTFIGPPTRFDVNVHLGPGLWIGRVRFDEIAGNTTLLADLAHFHINWELLQSAALEDYALVRIGVGMGLRFPRLGDDPAIYAAPELGLESMWTIDERGLTQLGFRGRARVGYEPSGQAWTEARAALGIERIAVAISDQPISLFVEPSVEHLAFTGGARQTEMRLTAGVRMSFFVPPREADDLCPGRDEDYDGFEDGDGCPDWDNDRDGVQDTHDACPDTPEDFDGDRDRDGCPE